MAQPRSAAGPGAGRCRWSTPTRRERRLRAYRCGRWFTTATTLLLPVLLAATVDGHSEAADQRIHRRGGAV